jgi:hypothetical protein
MTRTPTIGPVRSGWGKRKALIPGMSTFHRGVDIAAPTGTPVVASQAGVVTKAAYNVIRGHYVVVDHGTGFQTLSQHLSKRLAAAGQHVVEGERIGLVGRTGNVTGAHNHTEVHDNGTPIDPTPWYAARGVTLGVAGVTAPPAPIPVPISAPTLSDPEEDDDMYELITRMYRELMGREPDLEGAAGWLDFGRQHGAAAMVTALRASKPERGTVVAAFAAHGIGHAPTPADLASFLALPTVAEVWRQVAESPEVAARAAQG